MYTTPVNSQPQLSTYFVFRVEDIFTFNAPYIKISKDWVVKLQIVFVCLSIDKLSNISAGRSFKKYFAFR